MLEIGTLVAEKYKILKELGQGGTSIVYLALNEKANKMWAIKEIVKTDYKDFQMDKKEIELLKKLKHTHLPSIVDVIENNDTLLIVMDYIEGRSLEDILEEQGAQPEELVREWARQLCDVLQYLHTQDPPVIYRDMKPGNVMLRTDGKLVLIDFGAAREYKPQNLRDTICLGTRGYAAPEQYRDDGQSDPRTDIYCLGVMLFQLLTGRSPYELQPITRISPELSAGLEEIIQKCTQVKKEDRFQSAGELSYALEHYREYDKRYRGKQRQVLQRFLVPFCLTVFFFGGTMLFGFLEVRAKDQVYDTYIVKTENLGNKEGEVVLFWIGNIKMYLQKGSNDPQSRNRKIIREEIKALLSYIEWMEKTMQVERLEGGEER